MSTSPYGRRCIACRAPIGDLPSFATRCGPCHGAARRQESASLTIEVAELRREVQRLGEKLRAAGIQP